MRSFILAFVLVLPNIPSVGGSQPAPADWLDVAESCIDNCGEAASELHTKLYRCTQVGELAEWVANNRDRGMDALYSVSMLESGVKKNSLMQKFVNELVRDVYVNPIPIEDTKQFYMDMCGEAAMGNLFRSLK